MDSTTRTRRSTRISPAGRKGITTATGTLTSTGWLTGYRRNLIRQSAKSWRGRSNTNWPRTPPARSLGIENGEDDRPVVADRPRKSIIGQVREAADETFH